MTTRARVKIGADDAVAWARKLRLGNPLAKSILRAVANYMNEDGSAWPGVATIASDTDIAEDTVIARLRWCESIGAIALFKCWVDENGRRNFDGRGRVTSNEIRFLFDADPEAIEAAAKGATKPRALRGAAAAAHEAKAVSSRPDGEQTEEISCRSGRELIEDGSRLATDQPPTRAARREELEQKDSPPTPQAGGDDHDIEGEIEASEPTEIDGWGEFQIAFEADRVPILRISIAKGLFSALNPDERKLVTTAARGLIAQRRGEKKPGMKPSAQTFLREIDAWPGYAKLAPPKPAAPRPKITIEPGSDEFKALALCRAIARRGAVDHGSMVIVGNIPAGAAGLASLVTFKPGTHEVDQTGWTLAAKGSPRYVAWCERVKEWLGFWPEDHRYWLDESNNIVANASLAYKPLGKHLPRCKDGLMFPPLEWPPAKSSTDPPPNQSSAA